MKLGMLLALPLMAGCAQIEHAADWTRETARGAVATDAYDHTDFDYEFGQTYESDSYAREHWTHRSYGRHGDRVVGHVRTVRPDATGHFPGDPHGLNAPHPVAVGHHHIYTQPAPVHAHETMVHHGHETHCVSATKYEPVAVAHGYTCAK